MMKRLLLAILGFFILTWIGYVSYDLLHKENSENFRSYFHDTDGVIWAIHQPNEVNWNDHSIQTLSMNQALYSSLTQHINEPCTYIFGSRKVLFVAEKRSSWSKKEVERIFENGLFPFQLGKLNSFEYGKFHGAFRGNQLMIYEGELPHPNESHFEMDVKSSLSRILLSSNKEAQSVSDTYIKKGRIYTYKKTASQI